MVSHTWPTVPSDMSLSDLETHIQGHSDFDSSYHVNESRKAISFCLILMGSNIERIYNNSRFDLEGCEKLVKFP